LIVSSRFGKNSTFSGSFGQDNNPLGLRLLLAKYCRKEHNETVSIKRFRQLRNEIDSEAAEFESQRPRKQGKSNKIRQLKQITLCAKI